MTDHGHAGESTPPTGGNGARIRTPVVVLVVLAASLLGAAAAVGGAALLPDLPLATFGRGTAPEAVPASQAEVRRLTNEILQARTELRALEEEIKALLIDPDTDWEALAVPGRALATDCPAAAPLPSAPQREADVAYRAAGAVLHDPHPAFALAGSWPVAVALEDNTRLLLRVVPAVLSFMPEWQAGRAVTLCFAWLDGVAQPLLLADMNRAVG